MRRRWPEHCCPERHREDAAAQRALRGPSDASTHRNAAAGFQLSYSAPRITKCCCRARPCAAVGRRRRTRGSRGVVGAIYFSVIFSSVYKRPA